MSDSSPLQYVDGIPVPPIYSPDKFRSAFTYKPIPEDIFLVSYPKCGQTWTGQILQLVLQKGEPLKNSADIFKPPLIEMTGAKVVESMSRPLPIKSHLPFHLIPWSKDAKYIYVTRNPKDCCVSFSHHIQHLVGNFFAQTFDEFFEFFMLKEISKFLYAGDYFDHLLSWYAHRNEPNVLILTYEELKEDIDVAILKMASFINDEKYAEPMRRNLEILKNIKMYSSFKNMQENMLKTSQEIAEMTVEDLEKSSLPEVIKELLVKEKDGKRSGSIEKAKTQNIISKLPRKGEIGDWKNFFSEDQSCRMDEKFEQKTRGTDIPNLWKKYMR